MILLNFYAHISSISVKHITPLEPATSNWEKLAKVCSNQQLFPKYNHRVCTSLFDDKSANNMFLAEKYHVIGNGKFAYADYLASLVQIALLLFVIVNLTLMNQVFGVAIVGFAETRDHFLVNLMTFFFK